MMCWDESKRLRDFLSFGLEDLMIDGRGSSFAAVCISGCVGLATENRQSREEMLLNIIKHLTRRLAEHESADYQTALANPAPIMVNFDDLSDDTKAKVMRAKEPTP